MAFAAGRNGFAVIGGVAVGARIRGPCEADGSEPMTTPIRVHVVAGGFPPDGQLLKNAIDWGTGAEG